MYIYIYVLVCSCAYPCTEKVDLILKWIISWSWSGPKFASQFLSQFLSQIWPQLWLRCGVEAMRGVPSTIQDLASKVERSAKSAKLKGVLQVSQVRRQMVGTCGKRFMWQAIVDSFKFPRPKRPISTRGLLSKFSYRYVKSAVHRIWEINQHTNVAILARGLCLS